MYGKLKCQVSNRSCLSLRKKCPYSELFWTAFFPHFPAFRLNTPYLSVFSSNAGKCRKKADQNNSETDSLYAVINLNLPWDSRGVLHTHGSVPQFRRKFCPLKVFDILKILYNFFLIKWLSKKYRKVNTKINCNQSHINERTFHFLFFTIYLHFASWSNNCSGVGLAKETTQKIWSLFPDSM